MPRLVRALLVLVLLGAAGCDSGEAFDLALYEGRYVGVQETYLQSGQLFDTSTVTLTVERESGPGAVVVFLTASDGFGLAFRGTADESGIDASYGSPSGGSEYTLAIRAGGSVRGTYSESERPGRIEGVLTPSQFDLDFIPGGPDLYRRVIRTMR